MAYRRPDDESPEGSRWRKRHRSELIDCGIPQEILDSDRVWIYTLLHGSDEYGTGWDPTWITVEQAARLLARLEADLPHAVGYDLIIALRRRCGYRK